MQKYIESSSGSCGAWKIEFNEDNPGAMNFSIEGRLMAEFQGVELGVMKETRGIGLFTRLHSEEKTDWRWAETNVLLPFGPEPQIRRRWEQAGNHIRVSTEISVSSNITPEFVSVDSIRLPGKWKSADVFIQDPDDSLKIKKIDIDLTGDKEKNYNFRLVPLSVVFLSDDAMMLEIGVGYDIWRWMSSKKYNGASFEFSITVTDDAVLFKRTPLILPPEQIIPKTNLKFTWYFAWSRQSDIEKSDTGAFYKENNILSPNSGKLFSDKKTEDLVYSLNNGLWPMAAAVKGPEAKSPCFCSRQTENLLKYWIRFLQSEKTGQEDVVFIDIEPHLCVNSSHLERGEGKEILHWDYPYILAFWEWADRCLSSRNSKLKIILPQKSIFRNLPSVKGLQENE